CMESRNVGRCVVDRAIVGFRIRTTVRQGKEGRPSGIGETRPNTTKAVSGNSIFKQARRGTCEILIGATDSTVGNEVDLCANGRRKRKQGTKKKYEFLHEHTVSLTLNELP